MTSVRVQRRVSTAAAALAARAGDGDRWRSELDEAERVRELLRADERAGAGDAAAPARGLAIGPIAIAAAADGGRGGAALEYESFCRDDPLFVVAAPEGAAGVTLVEVSPCAAARVGGSLYLRRRS